MTSDNPGISWNSAPFLAALRSLESHEPHKPYVSGLKQGRLIVGQLPRLYFSLRLNSSFHERRVFGGFL
jgi:hypothetical protein